MRKTSHIFIDDFRPCEFVRVIECIITFADGTAETWVHNGVGAPNRRALLFTATDIPPLRQIRV